MSWLCRVAAVCRGIYTNIELNYLHPIIFIHEVSILWLAGFVEHGLAQRQEGYILAVVCEWSAILEQVQHWQILCMRCC